MCNAWNHVLGCGCGWGGGYGAASRNARLERGISLFTYTIPDALCPVCGMQVFFYKSPSGGRIFFDELGPPWPKHPCTDNGRPVRLVNGALRRMCWTSAGWEPLLILSSAAFHAGVTLLECLYFGSSLRLYVPKNRKKSDPELTATSLVQAKKIDELRYFLSTIDGFGRPLQLFAFIRSFDA
jgi:hypothetical protein